MIELKGITWDHSRGFMPLTACCQRYHEQHNDIDIQWHKRSLQAFADFSVEQLSKEYDLLVIDHPASGEAYESSCLVDFNKCIDKDILKDLQLNSTGSSCKSYTYKNAQLALPIDAATPVSSYRKDLFEKHNEAIPRTWEQLIQLAKAGKVALPAIPVDILMNFYMFCIAAGNEPFQSEEELTDTETGLHALDLMKELYNGIDDAMFKYNPIAVAELMSNGDSYWYCPFTYGYSNYSRKNYAKHLLTYDDVISYNDTRFRSTLGGTGIAVSAYSKHIDKALEMACMLASSPVQNGLYVEHGGQPAHLHAWKNEEANKLCNNFFSNTLQALQRAYVRPRYNGYLQFQDEAGNILHEFLKYNSFQPQALLYQLNALYRKSLARDEKQIMVS